MFERIKKSKILNYNIERLLNVIDRNNMLEWSYILGSKKEIIKRNLLAGIFRGVGIGIGITIITAIIIMLLKHIVTLNIPVIGEYIADIVEIVERSR